MSNEEIIKWLLPVFVGFSIRSAVLLHPHSGQGKLPMHGDYEAQRHWMEITTNLPISTWYQNSTDNDLSYWGLDYPPLTAYHSWLMGKFSVWFNSSWTELYTSRGLETYEHKVFMRYTVLFSELFIFVPSLLCFFHKAIPHVTSNPIVSPFYACCLALLYPGLILVDHGHFQYNSVSLGLFLASISSLLCDNDIIGTILFCLALGYKQMELYHALPLFFYLLGKCLRSPSGFTKLFSLATTVVFSFIIIFLPFITSMDQLYQILHRLFPLSRGLFEDKVANFWCSTSPLFKWKTLFSEFQLVRTCSLTVFITIFPSCLWLMWKPDKKKLLFTLAACSLSFFLFSYQVHEKSILLVAIPALCLLPFAPLSSFLFTVVSTLSMWPLFVKDDLKLACLSTTVIYLIISHTVIVRKSTSFGALKIRRANILLALILNGFCFLIIGEMLVSPPLAYPFIFPLLHSVYSFGIFVLFFIFWNYQVFSCKPELVSV